MNAIIIFIKNPELGKVKTRLAKTVGNEQALAIYHQLSKITRENTKELFLTEGVVPYLFYSDFIDNTDDWPNDIFKKHVQKGSDLGARMTHAFKYVLKKHSKVCIVGSDCPTLSVDILKQAFTSLANSDFTIGPSSDGGYYLLGIKKHQSFQFPDYIFDEIEWSTPQVLPTTLQRIANSHKTVELLPELTDIDEEKDWLAYQLEIKV